MMQFNKNYPYWRDNKLKNAITKIEKCFVEIKNPDSLTINEKKQIRLLCNINNFVLIQTTIHAENFENSILSINQQLGLVDNDKHFYLGDNKLVRITPENNEINNNGQSKFIPYTNKKLNWHTDGYYNSLENRIRSFSLFCANPAKIGGENKWLDIEILYILLYEKNPHLTKLLSLNNAMSIPAHIKKNNILRQESNGAIFFIDDKTNHLYMRYTQRKHNIIFNTKILEAIDLLNETLAILSDYHFVYKMNKGEGIINNNVIHTREVFENNKLNPRVMLRGRYFVRI